VSHSEDLPRALTRALAESFQKDHSKDHCGDHTSGGRTRVQRLNRELWETGCWQLIRSIIEATIAQLKRERRCFPSPQ